MTTCRIRSFIIKKFYGIKKTKGHHVLLTIKICNVSFHIVGDLLESNIKSTFCGSKIGNYKTKGNSIMYILKKKQNFLPIDDI